MDGPEARPSMYPWLKEGPLAGAVVLEPFKAATFTAVDFESAVAGLSYSWRIERPAQLQNEFELDLKGKRRLVLELNKVKYAYCTKKKSSSLHT